MGIVKSFKDGSFLEYNRGSFDGWCVFYTNTEGIRIAPKDTDYFKDLYEFSLKYGVDKLYYDYVKIYDSTEKIINEDVLIYITQIANEYDEQDRLEIDIMFSILYMAMISEENKKYSKLGKRIKRLGIYYLLIENNTIEESATFMTGMGWRDIDKLCDERGF